MYPWIKILPETIKDNTRKYEQSDNELESTINYEKKVGRVVRAAIMNELKRKI